MTDSVRTLTHHKHKKHKRYKKKASGDTQPVKCQKGSRQVCDKGCLSYVCLMLGFIEQTYTFQSSSHEKRDLINHIIFHKAAIVVEPDVY